MHLIEHVARASTREEPRLTATPAPLYRQEVRAQAQHLEHYVSLIDCCAAMGEAPVNLEKRPGQVRCRMLDEEANLIKSIRLGWVRWFATIPENARGRAGHRAAEERRLPARARSRRGRERARGRAARGFPPQCLNQGSSAGLHTGRASHILSTIRSSCLIVQDFSGRPHHCEETL